MFEWKSEKPAGISGRSLSSQIPIDFKVHEASHRQGKSRWPTSPDTQTAHDLRYIAAEESALPSGFFRVSAGFRPA